MTVAQVLYVLEVASCQNMSRAASRLFISQSALSQQILKLERELGYSLFSRSVRGIELTAAGERFCQEARPAVEAWQKLCHHVQAQNTAARKQLRIGMGSRMYSNGLFQDVVQFFDARPDIEVTFVTEAGRDFLANLRERRIDLALDRLPSEDHLAGQTGFYTCSLVRERQCVLMSRDDPRAALPFLSIQDLQGCTMISGLENSAEDRILKETCRRYGITLNRVYRSDGIETNMNLVRNGRGVVLGPQSFADYYHVAAVALLPEIEISLQFICLKSYIQRKEIRQLRDHLRMICRERGLLDQG